MEDISKCRLTVSVSFADITVAAEASFDLSERGARLPRMLRLGGDHSPPLADADPTMHATSAPVAPRRYIAIHGWKMEAKKKRE